MAVAHGLRDIIKNVSPPWKRTGIFEKLDYSMALILDMLIEKVSQSVAARIPTKTFTPTSLPFIGADRLISQGFVESSDNYAIRLQRAYDDWLHAGSARGMISQILGFLSPAAPRVETVSQTCFWDYVSVNSTPSTIPSIYLSTIYNWIWDANVTRFWRGWVIIGNTDWVTTGPVYGTFAATGARWGDGSRSWGLSVSSSIISSIRSIIGLWKYQGASCHQIIVAFSPTEFNPLAAPGDPNNASDGLWGQWHKITTDADGVRVAVRARSSNGRYCTGIT